MFYDGQCPLCTREVDWLRSLDKDARLELVDINQRDFSERYPEIDYAGAQQVLHGKLDGKVIYGLEVTYWAWTLVGKRKWVAPITWPVIRVIANGLYSFFARHRHTITKLLFADRVCATHCATKTAKYKHGQD